MKRPRSFEARNDRSHSKGKPRKFSGGGGGGGGGRAGGGGGRGPHQRHRPFGRHNERGPKTCPMCGAVVTDLGGHIRSKHDDAASHPRE